MILLKFYSAWFKALVIIFPHPLARQGFVLIKTKLGKQSNLIKKKKILAVSIVTETYGH